MSNFILSTCMLKLLNFVIKLLKKSLMSNRYSENVEVKPSTIKLRKDVKRGIREVIVKSADIVLPSQVLSLNCAYPFPNKIDIFLKCAWQFHTEKYIHCKTKTNVERRFISILYIRRMCRIFLETLLHFAHRQPTISTTSVICNFIDWLVIV